MFKWYSLFIVLFAVSSSASSQLSCDAIVLSGAVAPNPSAGVSEGIPKHKSNNTPYLIIVSAPSGAGKTTLVQKLLVEFPNQYVLSISVTTRAPRGEEKNGKDYFFVSKEEFQKRVVNGEFAEWAEVHGNFYGTPKAQVQAALASGKSVITVIDVKGAENLRQAFPNQNVSIFILPPSIKILEERLRGRGTDSDADVAKRIKNAKEEMAHQNEFDAIVVNDDLERAYLDLKTLLQ